MGLPGTKLPWSDRTKLVRCMGQMDGTNKNPMWAGVNGTYQEKAVRDCESQQILKFDWEWNNEILMWACVTGTTLNKFLDL